jgi:hypothetical protein
MSSDTALSISRSSEPASLTIACAGFCSVALQTVYFRELLSVFSGNELSIGIIFSVWLLSTGVSTMRGAAAGDVASGGRRTAVLVCLLCACAAAGFFLIRLSRPVFGSGIALPPLAMLSVIAVSVVPFTLVNGFLLGMLFSLPARSRALYGAENAGAVAGALCVFACILLSAKNSLIVAAALLPFLCIPIRRVILAGSVFGAVLCLMAFDHSTMQWKYPAIPLSRVICGHEGEIVSLATGKDTTFLVNGMPYKSTMEKPFLEQAVHIPMAQREHAGSALVVFDRGHGAELVKYPGLFIDIIETEPAFVPRAGRSRVAAVETFRPAGRYDVMFLGTGIPRTAASNRFYTRSFFLKAKSLISDSGIFSFSLPFSENYLSTNEQKLYDALLSTLGSVWKNIMVFPGEGYTFMASGYPLSPIPAVRARTEYLSSSIVPGVSQERIQTANKRPGKRLINTHDRPVTLMLGLRTWLDRYPGSLWALVSLFTVCVIAIVIVLPKTRDALSVASSGFATGIYSVCLLLLYQATYGSLYSRVSLLLVCLTAGFALGSRAKRFPLSDFYIGAFCVFSLCVCAMLPYPPAFLFYLFHAAAGTLAGAQFVTRRTTPPAALYAADLFGGAIGMAVCSTLLVPLFGIMPVAAGIFILKVVVEIINRQTAAATGSQKRF